MDVDRAERCDCGVDVHRRSDCARHPSQRFTAKGATECIRLRYDLAGLARAWRGPYSGGARFFLRAIGKLTKSDSRSDAAGEPIMQKLTRAAGNDAPIGGLKVVTASGWFAARPSGTEAVYKVYAESFRDEQHLQMLVNDAQQIVQNI